MFWIFIHDLPFQGWGWLYVAAILLYQLSLIGTRSAAIPVAIVPVGTAPVAAFAFPIAAAADQIAAVTIPVAAMAIPVAAVHVATVPLAVVAVLAPPPPPPHPGAAVPPARQAPPLNPWPCLRQMPAIPAIIQRRQSTPDAPAVVPPYAAALRQRSSSDLTCLPALDANRRRHPTLSPHTV